MKSIYEQKFGEFMKEKRKQAGLTYRELSEKLNIGIGYLGDIESSRASAPKRYLDKLVEVLNIQGEEVEKFYYLANISRNDTPDIYAKKVIEDAKLRAIVKGMETLSVDEVIELVKDYMNR